MSVPDRPADYVCERPAKLKAASFRPSGISGEVFAVLAFFSGLLVPAGSWYSGLLASYVGADWACMINNLFVIAVALAIRRRL